MKTIYTFLSFLLVGFGVKAQPTITEANMPQIGDMLPIVYCTDVPNESTLDAQTGANYTWDFTGLSTESNSAFTFSNPSTTLWSDDFPSSDLSGYVPENEAYAFYSTGSSELVADGFRLVIGPGDTLMQDYTDSELVLSLPANYNDNVSDNFSGSGFGGGFAFTVTGSNSYTIDGYGTLMLPTGTYTNVLRYRADRSEAASIGGFPATTIVKDQWIWVSADYRYWLLLMELIDDGVSVSDNVWYQSAPLAALTTGIADVAEEGFTVYPNPVAANGTLQLSRALNADESVQLFDTQGRMVKNTNEATSAVSLDGVSAGVYVLKILNGNGQSISTQKLIVQ